MFKLKYFILVNNVTFYFIHEIKNIQSIYIKTYSHVHQIINIIFSGFPGSPGSDGFPGIPGKDGPPGLMGN